MCMENPLLNQGPLPNFSDMDPELIEPALKQIISQNRVQLAELLAQNTFTWDNLMEPLEDMSDKLMKMWSIVSHMHAVVETEPLRVAYNNCLPLFIEHNTEFMQNEALYKAIKSIADGPEYAKFDIAQRKVIDDELRDFKLAGVSLPPQAKAQFALLQKELSHSTTQFAENLLDA